MEEDHGYREMTIGVPEEEMDEEFFEEMTECVHDFLMDRAIRDDKQDPEDCGNEEGPGCYGCNAVISARGVKEKKPWAEQTIGDRDPEWD